MDIEKLDAIMKEHGISRNELAKRLGITRQAVSQIWCGKRELTVKHIRTVALFLELTPEQVWDIFLFPESGTIHDAVMEAGSDASQDVLMPAT